MSSPIPTLIPLPRLTGPWSSGRPEDAFAIQESATGRELAVVDGGGQKEVEAAVARAHAAFATWRQVAPRERGRLLMRAAELIRNHADELAALETQEMGKPFHQSRQFDLEVCSNSFEFFGGLADKVPGEHFDLGPVSAHTVHEPYGVVGGIIPFNWPPIHTAAKAAPALAAGNTVVLKPPEQGPLTIMRIVELLQEVLPPGVIEVVPGLGATAGVALASHPLVRKLSFTGATHTGQAVLKLAADNLTSAVLELGGKNPFIVFADADLDAAVRGALEGGYFNQGEACTAASRLLVEDTIHDEFVARLAPAVRALRVGDGLDPSTHVGPLVTGAHQQRVLSLLAQGLAEGGEVVAEAALPDDPRLADGYFVAPTLVDGVTPEMTLAQVELFGPVSAVISFSGDEDEALAIANGVEYGLVGGVYTGNAERAARVARGLDVGLVMVNNYNRAYLGSPFGGTKASGYGREHAIDTLREFFQVKNIRQPSGNGHIPSWHVVDELLP
jgi:acyl-CoA reductase-like NAD-dependent aldehyde dehydrogenase